MRVYALLLTDGAAPSIARISVDTGDAARHHAVRDDLVRYRINVTGARKRIRRSCMRTERGTPAVIVVTSRSFLARGPIAAVCAAQRVGVGRLGRRTVVALRQPALGRGAGDAQSEPLDAPSARCPAEPPHVPEWGASDALASAKVLHSPATSRQG